MTEFEKATNRYMRRLHDAVENMYIYYDGDKQISKEEFERKINTEWQCDDCVTIYGNGTIATYHERR